MKNTWILAMSAMGALTLSSATSAGSLEKPGPTSQIVYPDGAVMTRQVILSDIIGQSARTETVLETQTTTEANTQTKRRWGLGSVLRSILGPRPSAATRPTAVFPQARAQNTGPQRGILRSRFGISHGTFR